tara:strand:- start:72 stop:317 length:246 start_codon:yes stop_codon:yes gene_type:complete
MNSFILGLTWLLFIVCFVLSLYFIYHLFQNSIYEPYLSKEADYTDTESVKNSIDTMISDIDNVVTDIDSDLDEIQTEFDSY